MPLANLDIPWQKENAGPNAVQVRNDLFQTDEMFFFLKFSLPPLGVMQTVYFKFMCVWVFCPNFDVI